MNMGRATLAQQGIRTAWDSSTRRDSRVAGGSAAVKSRAVQTMHRHDDSMSSRDYTRLCDLIYREAGIHLGKDKKIMLESRIRRRLKALELTSYGEYCDFLFAQHGLAKELVDL